MIVKSSLKDIIKNLVLSFLSYAMPTMVLQFVIQPIMASRLGGDLNGQYLTLMTLNYFFIGITASVLNTVRMLQNEEYEKKSLVGDFNVFFLGYAVLLAVIMPVGFVLYTKSFNWVDILLYVVIGLLYLYHDYIFAQYRLELNYKKILINNIILVVGYFIGLGIFFVVPKWQIVMISAYLLGGIYDFFNTTFIREPVRITPMFKTTAKKISLLTCSQSLSSMTTYCDKLILYPLLGGISVSVYNTAAIVGKMLILLSAPLNSVLLSYLVKEDSLKISFNKKKIAAAIGLLILAYGACVGVGFPLTSLLYPDWASESHRYIPLTVAISGLALLSNLLNTVVIRFYKTSFQVIIQSINLAVYIGLALTFMHFWSLWGFCVGSVLAGVIKMIILLVIIMKVKRQQDDEIKDVAVE